MYAGQVKHHDFRPRLYCDSRTRERRKETWDGQKRIAVTESMQSGSAIKGCC